MNKKEQTIGKCKLCKQTLELRDSHIVSKMFYDLIKNNSVTARMRESNNPNIPLQDGFKIPFLCTKCEGKFGEYERKFSNIYRKYTSSFGKTAFDSDSDMYRYFVLSIGWRVLQYLNDEGIGEITTNEQQAIDSKLEEWRSALWNENHKIIRQQKQYIIPTTYLSYFSKIPTHRISNVGFDFRVFGGEDSFDSAFTTSQVPYLLFISMVWGEEEMLADYEVGKKIVPADIQLPKTLTEQLDKFHENMFGNANKILSDVQREKIESRVSSKTRGTVSIESLSKAYQHSLMDGMN